MRLINASLEKGYGPAARLAPSARVAAALVFAGLVTGCVSVPATTAGDVAEAEPGLYAGQPETVYATEFPVESAADARERAAQAIAEGDIDRALYMYVQAVKLDPDDSESLYRIGEIHARKGNGRLSARAFARAIEIDPEHAAALEGLGVAYFEARETERARGLLERAVAADAGLWRAHNVLGVIADMSGEHAAAIGHYGAAIELRPGAASLLNNRGYSSYLAGDYEAAEADYRAAIDSNPEYERAWENLGLLYARQRRYGFALRALSRVKERHVAANDVGYIAMLDEDFDSAEILFNEAKRESPRFYETAEQNLAELERRRGAAADAQADADAVALGGTEAVAATGRRAAGSDQ